MCSAVGIPCRVVKGKVKGSGYRLGGPVDGANDYCVVYVNNSWRFVDPHWGSQFVITSVDNNDDWEMIRPDSPTGGAGGKKDSDNQEEEIGYNCDDFYFLTDPVAMVYTHLTCDPQLQVHRTLSLYLSVGLCMRHCMLILCCIAVATQDQAAARPLLQHTSSHCSTDRALGVQPMHVILFYSIS